MLLITNALRAQPNVTPEDKVFFLKALVIPFNWSTVGGQESVAPTSLKRYYITRRGRVVR